MVLRKVIARLPLRPALPGREYFWHPDRSKSQLQGQVGPNSGHNCQHGNRINHYARKWFVMGRHNQVERAKFVDNDRSGGGEHSVYICDVELLFKN